MACCLLLSITTDHKNLHHRTLATNHPTSHALSLLFSPLLEFILMMQGKWQTQLRMVNMAEAQAASSCFFINCMELHFMQTPRALSMHISGTGHLVLIQIRPRGDATFSVMEIQQLQWFVGSLTA